VAGRLVIPPHRDGGQAQFIEQPLPLTTGGHRLARLIETVRQRLNEDHHLDSLAAEARMSRHSFTRQFSSLTGSNVLRWLLTERLHLAQRLLEQTDQPIEWVAELAGFDSAEALRHHFRNAFHTTPMDWRRSFRGEVPIRAPTASQPSGTRANHWPMRRAASAPFNRPERSVVSRNPEMKTPNRRRVGRRMVVANGGIEPPTQGFSGSNQRQSAILRNSQPQLNQRLGV
jgi:AraC-like DNA-binding protein